MNILTFLILTTTPIDLNQIILAFFVSIPATIAALMSAALAWHNRAIVKEVNTTTKDTKTIVNGRMDQLLAAAAELAEIKGRNAANADAVVLKAATDKAVSDIIKENNGSIERRTTAG